MKINDVSLLSDKLVLAKPADVEKIEQELWINFPKFYLEYVTQLGEGVLGGSLIRIYPPWRISSELDAWRGRIDSFWFWDKGAKLLPKARALECVIIGDTLNGDELIFHPSRPEQLFVLPRGGQKVFDAGSDLLSAIEWICSSGKLCRSFAEREFEPFDSRLEQDEVADDESEDPPGESIEDICALMKKWVKRHQINRKANADMRKAAGKGIASNLLFKGVCLDSDMEGCDADEFMACWDILDKKSGKPIGRFIWSKGEFSEGSSYKPA